MTGDAQPFVEPRPPWHQHAACRSLHPDTFYRVTGETEAGWQLRSATAKQHCCGCPVRQECLNAAIVSREPEGIWGGVEFPREWRKAMRLASRAREGLEAVDGDGDAEPAAALSDVLRSDPSDGAC